MDEVKTGRYPYPEGYDVVQPPSPAGGGEGGNPSLYEEHVRVDLQVKNNGTRSGKEVVQLYVSLPSIVKEPSNGALVDTPIRVLRNFTKIQLEAGASQDVSLTLSRKDLSYWSVIEQNWVMPDGEFTVSVGRNSRDAALQGTY